MATDKKFVVKNGLTTQNIAFVDNTTNTNNTITVTMIGGDVLSFSGDSGQLFSITDSLTGTIFAVNDISGVPSIEVDDDGTIRFAETFGNILIGTATDNATDKLQVEGSISVTGTVDGRDVAVDGAKLDGITAGATPDQTITLSGDLTGSGTTSINAQLAANVVTAAELNVTGNGTTAQYLRSDGDGSFTWDDPTVQVFQTRQQFVATASQTSFATSGYTAGLLDVYFNGIHLLDNTDYTATNGTDVVLTTGAALNDVIETVAYSSFEVANAATAAQGVLAGSALQPSAIGVSVQGYTTVLANTTASYTTAEETKLSGIETGATADQTAAEILTAIKTVDGTGSGLDADTLDGIEAASFLQSNQTITLSGDLTGSGTTSINAQLAANVVTAAELNVTGNGTTAQYLRSDADGSFTWDTPPDTNTNTDTLQDIAADATDVAQYITFVPNTTGAQTGRVDAGLTYNPSSNTLDVTGTVTATDVTLPVNGVLTFTGDADTESTTLYNDGIDFFIDAGAGAVPGDIRMFVATGEALKIRNDGSLLANSGSNAIYDDSALEGFTDNAYVFAPNNSRAMQVRSYNTEALALNRMGSTPQGDVVTIYKDGVKNASMGTESTDSFYFDNELGADIKFKIGGTTNVQFQSTEVDFNVPLRFNAGVGNTFMHVEGVTDDTFEVDFAVTDPTADRTITFKDETGTVALLTDLITNTDTLQDIAADATNVNQYITFVPNTTGAQTGRVDAGLTYNPSTNNLSIGNDLTVGGNLIVNGTTTTVNSTTVTIDDPIFTVGGDTAPIADDNKDRGIEFRYFNTTAKVGFFGFDDSTGKFTFIPDATNTAEVFSGTTGELDAKIDWSNILNAPASTNGTNLSNTATGTSLTVESSTGTNTALPAATTSTWGVMTDEMFDAIVLNTAKITNVTTNLGYTTAASTGTVTSSDGTNATLPAATTSLAGLLTGADKTKLDGINQGVATTDSPTFVTVNATNISLTNDLAVADGGTGASTAAAARTNLDVDQAGTALALAIALG